MQRIPLPPAQGRPRPPARPDPLRCVPCSSPCVPGRKAVRRLGGTRRMQPLFFYDLGSPYAWLTAERIDALFGEHRPLWLPVLLGAIFKATGRGSWAETDARADGIAAI